MASGTQMGDCGCGRGPKKCISKDPDVAYFLGLYKQEFPNNKLKGKKLKADMMAFVRDKMKELDCGCGCGGLKALKGGVKKRLDVAKVAKKISQGYKTPEGKSIDENDALTVIGELAEGGMAVVEFLEKMNTTGHQALDWMKTGKVDIENFAVRGRPGLSGLGNLVQFGLKLLGWDPIGDAQEVLWEIAYKGRQKLVLPEWNVYRDEPGQLANFYAEKDNPRVFERDKSDLPGNAFDKMMLTGQYAIDEWGCIVPMKERSYHDRRAKAFEVAARPFRGPEDVEDWPVCGVTSKPFRDALDARIREETEEKNRMFQNEVPTLNDGRKVSSVTPAEFVDATVQTRNLPNTPEIRANLVKEYYSILDPAWQRAFGGKEYPRTPMEQARNEFITEYGITPERYILTKTPGPPDAKKEKKAIAASGWKSEEEGFIENPFYAPGPQVRGQTSRFVDGKPVYDGGFTEPDRREIIVRTPADFRLKYLYGHDQGTPEEIAQLRRVPLEEVKADVKAVKDSLFDPSKVVVKTFDDFRTKYGENVAMPQLPDLRYNPRYNFSQDFNIFNPRGVDAVTYEKDVQTVLEHEAARRMVPAEWKKMGYDDSMTTPEAMIEQQQLVYNEIIPNIAKQFEVPQKEVADRVTALVLKLKSRGGLSQTGSGRRQKTSLQDINMLGTGSPEDLAYMGIDTSMVGSGRPSYERAYTENQADAHRKKVELVRRRASERTVKILPYTQRPELLSDTFKVGPHGRDIHGQIQGGGKFRPELLPVKEAGAGRHKKARILTKSKGLPDDMDISARQAKRFLKAVKAAARKKGGARLVGGDWFSPSTWTLESVNPANWTKEDWTDLAKGADAAIFGPLADPYVLKSAQGYLVAGGSFAIPGVGTVAGTTLAAILQGAVMAHEFVYPGCDGGKKEGILGCNEYRDDLKDIINTAVGIAKTVDVANEKLDRTSEFLTAGIGEGVVIQPGDFMGSEPGNTLGLGRGSGAYRGAFTRGELPVGEKAEEFYWPEFSGREARGVAAAGGEYAGQPRMESSLAEVRTF